MYSSGISEGMLVFSLMTSLFSTSAYYERSEPSNTVACRPECVDFMESDAEQLNRVDFRQKREATPVVTGHKAVPEARMTLSVCISRRKCPFLLSLLRIVLVLLQHEHAAFSTQIEKGSMDAIAGERASALLIVVGQMRDAKRQGTSSTRESW